MPRRMVDPLLALRSARWRLACRIAVVAVVLGVFCTWVAQGDLTLNGIKGPRQRLAVRPPGGPGPTLGYGCWTVAPGSGVVGALG